MNKKYFSRWSEASLADLDAPKKEKYCPKKAIKKAKKSTFCTREQLEVIEAQARRGSSKRDCAHFLGVDTETLCVWLKERRHVRDAWEKGRAEARDSLRSTLFRLAETPSKDQLRAAIYLAQKLVWKEKKEAPKQALQVDINMDAYTTSSMDDDGE